MWKNGKERKKEGGGHHLLKLMMVFSESSSSSLLESQRERKGGGERTEEEFTKAKFICQRPSPEPSRGQLLCCSILSWQSLATHSHNLITFHPLMALSAPLHYPAEVPSGLLPSSSLSLLHPRCLSLLSPRWLGTKHSFKVAGWHQKCWWHTRNGKIDQPLAMLHSEVTKYRERALFERWP